MAKRKRLSPIAQPAPAGTGPETRSIAPPPIADVAGSVAREAAFDAVSDELAAARAEGRMVASLPLDSIEAGHLERDRLYADPEEMLILCDSIRDRGQQTPIEVEEIGGEKYGLISGWRRLMALRALCGQDADPRFARVQALIRTPENTVAAYRAMVEENEIRADLSHYERARIAVLATQKGVFPSAKIAVRTLFAAARAPKRSKILSFTVLVEALAPHVTFPTALPEKLGLALVAALEADPLPATASSRRCRPPARIPRMPSAACWNGA